MTGFEPTALYQITIRGAHRVGVDMMTARQLTHAGNALPGLQIFTDHAQHQLRRDLLAHADRAFARQPQAHGNLYTTRTTTSVMSSCCGAPAANSSAARIR